MYRLLIVDDEPRQVNALVNIVHQMRPQYEVFAAYDGQDALKIMSTNPIDIVMTDIRMPQMDGLQFVESLNKNGNHSKIVIISGYGEFEYAQKAIRFGVNDYLTKPISKADLIETIEKIEAILSNEYQVKTHQNTIKQKLDSSLPIYLEHLLTKWVTNKITEDALGDIQAIFPHDGYGVVSITAFSGLQEILPELEPDFMQYAKFRMKDSLRDIGHSISFFLESDRRLMVTVLVSDHPFHFNSSSNESRLSHFMKDILDRYHIVSTIGVSHRVEHILKGIAVCFKNAMTAIENKFFLGLNRVIYAEHNNAMLSTYKVDSQSSKISEAVRAKDKVLAIKCVSEIFETAKNMPGVKPDSLKEEILQLLLDQSKFVINLLDKDEYTVFNEHIKCKTNLCEEYGALWHFANETLAKVIDIMSDKYSDKNGMLISSCVKYMQERYMDDISLEKTAQKYFFNPSYFGNLFKSYTGNGFTEHLLHIRIDSAKKLLNNTKDTISKIAAKVGIKDASYFIRVFKKETGVSPLRYRQMNRDRAET